MQLRSFLKKQRTRILAYAILSLCAAYPFFIEPYWLTVKHLRLSENPGCRIVHFTDMHYSGNECFWNRIAGKINALDPDFVCFTGDLIETADHLEGALEFIKKIDCPVYGVPGNHDYWSNASFDDMAAAFEATGGAFLVDETAVTASGEVGVIGMTGRKPCPEGPPGPAKQILLTHYPKEADELDGRRFGLILAGHSHGGQVRIPLWGAPRLPGRVGAYDRGLFETPAGPLHVNPGIGFWYLRVRLFCRPEITLIEF